MMSIMKNNQEYKEASSNCQGNIDISSSRAEINH